MSLLQTSLPSAIADLLHLPAGEITRAAVQVVVIWAMAWAATLFLRLVARRIVAAADDGDPNTLTVREKQSQTISQLLRGVGRVLVVLAAALLTLDVFFDIGPLLAGAGILGLAVSFGAQSLVKDVISGFFILLENQFGVGDVVEAAGKTGTVEQMSLRVVKLRDVRGVLHIIPNGQIGVVSNATRGWGREVIDVGVAYDVDVDEALRVFRDEASRFGADAAWGTRMDGAPEVLGVESLTDHAVIIRTLVRARPGEQWALGREFRRRILRRLETEGMEIPMPRRMVQVRTPGGPAGPMEAIG